MIRFFRSSALARQATAFVGVGLIAAAVHYALLVSLVEGYGLRPVTAALAGYVGGGIVSYLLNRKHTYASERPHREAGWRFGVVAAVGFALTWGAMTALTERLALPYLPSQIATTAIVLFWSFSAHKFWTFREPTIPLT